MSDATIREAFYLQSKSCRELGSPFMERLCRLLAENLPSKGAVWEYIEHWSGDVTASGASVPLRLAGSLHALVLSNECPELTAVYPPKNIDVTDAQLLASVFAAVDAEQDFILKRMKYAPQTNEVRRAGILFPGFQYIAAQTGMTDLVTSELGASAGLNLFWDKFRYTLGEKSWGPAIAPVEQAPDWKGTVPELASINVVERGGCDLNPLDIHNADEQLRLLSYLWPDQRDRMEKTIAAIAFAREQKERVVQQDAIAWLEQRLASHHEGRIHVIYHTIAWQYFPEEGKVRGKKMIQEAGLAATKEAPLAWLRLEADGDTPGAALTVTLWPGGETKTLARGDFHGRWIDWFM